MNAYIGHESQLSGVEEHRLVGGRGDGMRLLQVRNGKGLEFTVSADRCMDVSRLSFRGDNYGFFSANGYVTPAYYDDKGDGWLKTFTAGFLTTCGLVAVGSPCCDQGAELPLHGAVGQIPADRAMWDENEDEIALWGTMRHERIFDAKLRLTRRWTCSKRENRLRLTDTIENVGDIRTPLMILYHMNMGYPLLSESAELLIPAREVLPRNDRAAEDLDTWHKVISPTPGFEEQCYYHEFRGKPGLAGIFNPAIGKGLVMKFDSGSLDCFVEWKMMGVRDYVMGLEIGNCYPDGRDVMREQGRLKFLDPGQTQVYTYELTIVENAEQWAAVKASV